MVSLSENVHDAKMPLTRLDYLATMKNTKDVCSNIQYCMLPQKGSFSSQTFQGATGTSLCRILDRDTALESSNAEL